MFAVPAWVLCIVPWQLELHRVAPRDVFAFVDPATCPMLSWNFFRC